MGNTTTPHKARAGKIIRIVAIACAAFLVMNTIATKIIYDSIFAEYREEPDYNLAPYEDFLSLGLETSFEGKENSLVGYYYDNPDTEELLVIAPGLHSGAEDFTVLSQAFYEDGYDIYIFDPTGTGKSGGTSNIGYSEEIYDLDGALCYVEENLTYKHLYVLGHSRGATAAVAMLSEYYGLYGTSSHDIDGVIAVSGFNSAMDAVIGIPEHYAGPIVNFNKTTLWLYQRTLFNHALLNLEASAILNTTDVPVLVIAGSEDSIATPEKHSIYAFRDEITAKNITFFLEESEGFNGHTSVLYQIEDGVAAVNEEVLIKIESFLSGNLY